MLESAALPAVREYQEAPRLLSPETSVEFLNCNGIEIDKVQFGVLNSSDQDRMIFVLSVRSQNTRCPLDIRQEKLDPFFRFHRAFGRI